MKEIVYLDNAATTYPKPDEVYKFMDSFYRCFGVNVGRGQYKLADIAYNLVKETRQLLLELLCCPQMQVVFSPSATEAINIILRGIEWKDDFNVYITPFEHNAVLRVLKYLQNQYRINIVELMVDNKSMVYDLENIKYQFQNIKPDVVIISHASNVCGLIAPIEEICKMSKKYGAINIIDMAQTAGLIQTDLGNVQADYVVFAGHKTLYAPFGVAGFILKRESTLKPFLYGGTGVNSAELDMPSTIPERFEVGSMNILAIAGLNASLKWINRIGINNIFEKELANAKMLIEVVNQFDNIKKIGYVPGSDYVGVLSCIFDGLSSDNVGQILSEKGIATRTGLHCAPYAHRFLGTYPQGTVRFSVSYFNENNDFEKLFQVLSYIAVHSY